MNIDYNKIYNILKINNNTLIFDFEGVDFLNTFEIAELFAFAVTVDFSGNTYQIISNTKATEYLLRINFFPVFEKIKGMAKCVECSVYTGNSDELIEVRDYDQKAKFDGDYDKIFRMLMDIGLTLETTSLVASSLGEIVDNAFSHNLGKWPVHINGKSVLLAQKFPNKRELNFSYIDFGVGFRNTLAGNYPQLSNNYEAIELAIKENVTSRSPQRGGNGLNYLQKNIFNGFKGELLIRSGEALAKVQGYGNVQILNNDVQVGTGTNIFFSLKY